MAMAASATPPKLVRLLLTMTIISILFTATTGNNATAGAAQGGSGNTWCVAKSGVSGQKLQKALDYACGSGADCVPIQRNGSCFLPDTVQAHASFAFNSYYQRNAAAPGSCHFAGAATITRNDPSYGSCVYPPCRSTAAGKCPPTNVSSPPSGAMTFSGGDGAADAVPPGVNPTSPQNTGAKLANSFFILSSSLLFLFLTS